ncbi:MAG TPA: hypothetical protein VME19_18450 [Streptosporangiaceae bacterium]|nr:hypothetical protein [Streptosporangiaceae bacterium]
MIIVAAISVVILRHSPSTGNLAAASTTSAAASTVAPSASDSSTADCRSQAISWRDNGGLSQLDAVITDIGTVQEAATALSNGLWPGGPAAQDEAALKTAAASLKAGAHTAQANLPPSCVPNLGTDEGTALNDASKAAIDCENAVSELGSGNSSVGTDDLDAANAAMTASRSKLQAAASDVQAFNNG